MRQHRGEILEDIVRKSGYSIKALSQRMGVSRNTVYNKFREADLNYGFIARVGSIIHYDVTKEYPAIQMNKECQYSTISVSPLQVGRSSVERTE